MSKRLLASALLGILVLGLYAWLIGWFLIKVGPVSALIVAGDRFTDGARTPDVMPVFPDSDGYDGQFYYRLATDPFTNQVTDYGVRLDYPSWRQQRILYPLLAHLVAKLPWFDVPTSLLIVNACALTAIVGLAFAIATELRASPLYATVLALHPGFFISLLRDLTEVTEIALLLLAVWLYIRRRPASAIIALSLAILAKETALLLAVAVLVTESLTRRRVATAWLAPMAIPCLWQVWLSFNWADLSHETVVAQNITLLPFKGIVDSARASGLLNRGDGLAIFAVVCAIICLILYKLPRSKACSAIKLGWFLYSLLLVFVTHAVWTEGWAYWRALSEWYVLSVIILMGRFTSRITPRRVDVSPTESR